MRLPLLIAVLAIAGPACAADFELLQTQPTAGAMLDKLDRLELAFSVPIDVPATRIQVVDVLGRRLQVGDLARDPYDRKVVRARVTGRPQPGPLRIEWRATSLAGEAGRGRFSVLIRPPPAERSRSRP